LRSANSVSARDWLVALGKRERAETGGA